MTTTADMVNGLAELIGESVLNGWEEGFIESISEQLEDGRDLTQTQLEKLAQIWTERN